MIATHFENYIDLTEWELRESLRGIPVEQRIHKDGYNMWHRVNCVLGAKMGALAVAITEPLPYEVFEAQFEVVKCHTPKNRNQLFCGCLIKKEATS